MDISLLNVESRQEFCESPAAFFQPPSLSSLEIKDFFLKRLTSGSEDSNALVTFMESSEASKEAKTSLEKLEIATFTNFTSF